MNWKTATLGEIATIERKGIDASDIVSGTDFIGLEHIQSGGEITGSQCVENGEISSTKFRFSKAHVLYGKLRPYLAKIALPNFEGVCSTDILPIAPGPNLDRRYLAYCLRQPSMVDFANSRSTGANLPRLSPKVLATFQIPFPPLEEQRQIAAILDKADAVRRKRKEAIALTEELLRSVFLDMFGDPVTNSKGWETDVLGNVGTLERGKSKHRPRNDPTLLNGPYPLIQTGEVSNSNGLITEYTQTYSEKGLAQSRMWPTGTLCITIAANIADTGILTFDACFPDSVVGFRPSEAATSEYVQGWFGFLQPVIEEKAPQVAQKNINLKILRELEISVPPLEIQEEYAKFVSLVREHTQRKLEQIKETDALFNSLLQRAFRGEL